MSTRDGTEQLLALLAATDLFKGLAAADLGACASRFRQVRFGKGQIVFGRGDAGTHLYLIAEGQVDAAVMVTAEIGIDGVAKAFADLANPEAHTKIIVQPWR